MIEVCEAKKYSDIVEELGHRPFRDHGNAVGVHRDTVRRYHVPRKEIF